MIRRLPRRRLHRLVRFLVVWDCFDMRPDAVNGMAIRIGKTRKGWIYPLWLCHKPSIRIDLLPSLRCPSRQGIHTECSSCSASNEYRAASDDSGLPSILRDRTTTTHNDHSERSERPLSPHQDPSPNVVHAAHQEHGSHIPKDAERTHSQPPNDKGSGVDVQYLSSSSNSLSNSTIRPTEFCGLVCSRADYLA